MFKEDVLWIRTLVSFWSVLVVGNLLLAVNFWWCVVKYLSQSVAPSRVTESDSKLIIALQKAELGTLSLLPFKKLLCSGIILCLYRGINYCAAFFQNVSCFMCYRTLWMFVCVFVKCHRVCFTSSAISALKPCSSPCCINHLLVKNSSRHIFRDNGGVETNEAGGFGVCCYTPKHTHKHTERERVPLDL